MFLIGFMASGKTTLGHALADAVPGLRFIDLDSEVEKAAGATVTEIFAAKGEDAFRKLESDTLRAVAGAGGDALVVACGGGTPCRKANMDYMHAAGTVVYLEASVDTIVRRLLEADPAKRPLLASCAGDAAQLERRVCEMLDARLDAYSGASEVFDADRLDTPEQIAESTARFIHRFIEK